jgi:hypothetical protein
MSLLHDLDALPLDIIMKNAPMELTVTFTKWCDVPPGTVPNMPSTLSCFCRITYKFVRKRKIHTFKQNGREHCIPILGNIDVTITRSAVPGHEHFGLEQTPKLYSALVRAQFRYKFDNDGDARQFGFFYAIPDQEHIDDLQLEECRKTMDFTQTWSNVDLIQILSIGPTKTEFQLHSFMFVHRKHPYNVDGPRTQEYYESFDKVKNFESEYERFVAPDWAGWPGCVTTTGPSKHYKFLLPRARVVDTRQQLSNLFKKQLWLDCVYQSKSETTKESPNGTQLYDELSIYEPTSEVSNAH